MFFSQLEKLCKERNTTPTSITVKLGYSKGSMSQWKKGSCPSGDVVANFAKYFNVSTDYFLLCNEVTTLHSDVIYSQSEKECQEMTSTKRFAAFSQSKKMRIYRRELGYSIKRFVETVNQWKDVMLTDEDIKFIESQSFDEHLLNHKRFFPTFEKQLETIENYLKQYYPDNYEWRFTVVDKNLSEFLEEDEYSKTPIALNIEGRRLRMGFTQKQLADKLQLEEISIISWESGERIPNKRCMELLHAFLGGISTETSSEFTPPLKQDA